MSDVLYHLEPDRYPSAPPEAAADYEGRFQANTPIVFDNGASFFRAGWAGEINPRIVAENVVSRYRDRKTNQMIVLAGSAVYADATSKLNIKYPYEGEIMCAIDAVENMMDYSFVKMGIDSGDSIQHPIAITEPICNPAFSRGLVSELLFECYSVPTISYANDALASFYGTGLKDGLIVSSSASNTVVMPVIDGVAHLNCTKRLSWGGTAASDYMLKLLQMKYPNFPQKLSFAQANTILKEHSYLSENYAADIQQLSDPEIVTSFDRIIQAPFQTAALGVERTEEELAEQTERRREQMRKMQEQAAKQREEKMLQREKDLQDMLALKALKLTEPREFLRGLSADGFADEEELDQIIKKTQASLEKSRKRAAGLEEEEKEAPSYPLADVPDDQLTEDQIKEKRRQKLMRAGYEARIKARAEKEAERLRLEAEANEEAEFRAKEPEKWLGSVREQYEDIIERMKDRQKKKTQLTDRKSLAAQNRMKTITTMASDVANGKKKRKTAEDTFGANDADWAVYRAIGGNEDSDAEEDDQMTLRELEQKLLQYDPDFTEDDTADRRNLKRTRLLNAFVRGMKPEDPLSVFDPHNSQQVAQLHVNIERIRVPEALYQPSIAGVDQAGLIEIIGHILRQYSPAEQERLLTNVYVTGGHTLTPNFDSRLKQGLQSILPVGTPFRIIRAADAIGSAWQGLAKFATTQAFHDHSMTRQEYYECGAEYLKDNPLLPIWLSN